MVSAETRELLRSILDEVCDRHESGTKAHVASKLLEAAAQGLQTIDDLREKGLEALKSAPTMWRY